MKVLDWKVILALPAREPQKAHSFPPARHFDELVPVPDARDLVSNAKRSVRSYNEVIAAFGYTRANKVFTRANRSRPSMICVA